MTPIAPETKAENPSPNEGTPPSPSVEDAVTSADVLATKGLSVYYGNSIALRDITIAIPIAARTSMGLRP